MKSYQTLQEYLFEIQDSSAILNDELRLLIETFAKSCQEIIALTNRGILSEIFGEANAKNIHGEQQKKLDIITNSIFLNSKEWGNSLIGIASEEMDKIQFIENNHSKNQYLLLIDPLDGSSNINTNISIGTIFSVLGYPKDQSNANQTALTEKDFLQAGTKQIAAGYVLYGPQSLLVFTVGNGVVGFTLDNQLNTWVLTHSNFSIPQDTQEFSINVSNMKYWDKTIKAYIMDCINGSAGPFKKDYNMRWVGSMVADVHRLLIRGGIFLYPWDNRQPQNNGKIRLMYEANPMSFLIEQAGGEAISGIKRILEIKPTTLHERVSIILGSKNEVKKVYSYYMNNM